jgi:hypothetical protein
MLEIAVKTQELFNEETETFSVVDVRLQLEHSLVSVSKWESRFCKPFLGNEEKTTEEVVAYIQDMIITPGISPEVVNMLSSDNLKAINEYINSKCTATRINDTKQTKSNREIITSELVYYWMVALQIPFECQHWHLNRLLTLIQVCNIKNQPPSKVGRAEQARRFREMNEQRRTRLGTSG